MACDQRGRAVGKGRGADKQTAVARAMRAAVEYCRIGCAIGGGPRGEGGPCDFVQEGFDVLEVHADPRADNPDELWNGSKDNEGPVLTTGVYVYQVKYIDARGQLIEFNGFATLLL